MLVVRDSAERARAVDRRDDEGVGLVVVVMLMLVGVVIATVIAASVLVTIRLNVTNKSQTQAFVAAESGRDSMLAAVMANGCTNHISDSADPHYENVTAAFGADSAHLTDACVSSSPPATAVIQITSTGVGPQNDRTTVVSTYQRLVTTEQQPGGSLAYFSGTFKLTQSTYKGDVVIRDGNYTCNSTSTITGDLWVPKGGVDISASCNINGNIYSRDGVQITGSGSVIGTSGDPATGTIACDVCTAWNPPTGPSVPSGITVKGPATIWKDILSSTNIGLQNVTVHGSAKAGGSLTVTGNNVSVAGVSVPSGTTAQNITPSPSSTAFVPSLADVYAMTNWLDIGFTKSLWGTDVQWKTIAPGNCTANVTPDLSATLLSGNTRYGFDYSSCASNVTITLAAGPALRSAVFLVPASATMTVKVTGDINSIGAPTAPGFFFIHADARPDSAGPDCGPSPTQPVDSFQQANNTTVGPYLMFYTPCGLGSVPNQNQVTAYNGQFYAADNETSTNHWVQPNFVCKPMAWTPLINLGCYIKDAVQNGPSGNIVTQVHPPALQSQIEVPTP